jgi:hypothetical protein
MPKPLFALLALPGLLLGACASQTEAPASALQAPQRSGELRDFSGHWEKNFQLSDDFNTRFSLYTADIRRLIARMNQGNLEGLPTLGGRGVNVNAIGGLARFVEELTRMPLLDIVQDDTSIEIERQDDFTLRCAYADLQYVRSSNTFGNDLCGWNGEQLQFRMELAGGLSIQHQFTLSPDASMLNVMTTVSTSDVSVPLVISNFYERFDPPEEDYNCVLTLTRATVCNQRGTPR